MNQRCVSNRAAVDSPERVPGTGSGPTPQLTNVIVPSPLSVTLANGESATVGLEIIRASPHGPAALAATRLPFGVSASIVPVSVKASLPTSTRNTVDSARLTLVADSAAPAGQSSCLLTAGGASGTVSVAVSSPFSWINGAPDVSIDASRVMSVSSAFELVLAAFGSVTAPVNVDVAAGVSGLISFAVTGLPSGVTAQCQPATISASGRGRYGVETRLTAGAQVTPWIGRISVEISVAGALRGSVSFALEIVAPSVSFVGPMVGAVPMLGSPGTSVTIDGRGFGPGTTVTFGADNRVVASSRAADGTSLAVEVPRTAASGPLSVVSPAGSAPVTPAFAVDTYRNTRGFSWQNTTNFQTLVGSSYSFSDAVALFGASATQIPILGIENPVVAAFLVAAEALLDSHGQCFGMCLASLRFTAGQASTAGFPTLPASTEPSGPPGPDVWLLEGPVASDGSNLSPGLSSFVHQQHLAQLSQENIDNWVSFHASVSSASDLRSNLQSAFAAAGRNMGAMVCLTHSIFEGHCVVAYDIVDHADGSFDILVYNPNVPFDPSEDADPSTRVTQAGKSVIQVSDNGDWVLLHSSEFFDQTTTDWTGGLAAITVVPWNTIPVQPSVPWAEMAALAAAFALIVAGDAQVAQVRDTAGRTLLADAEWNTDPQTQLPGVRPMPAFGGLGVPGQPAIVGRTDEPLLTTITGTSQGSYSAFWVGGGSSVRLGDVPTAQGSTDTVRIATHRLDFAAHADKAVRIEMIGVGSQSQVARIATIITSAARGAPLSLDFDPATETFSYTQTGAPADYTLELSTFSADGKAVSYRTKPKLAEQAQTLTFRPDWGNLASTPGL